MSTKTTVNQRQRNTSRLVKVSGSDGDPDNICQADFEVEILPGKKYPSPLAQRSEWVSNQLLDDAKGYIMHDPQVAGLTENGELISKSKFMMRLASARSQLHFNPATTTVGIVTCGGLCPGLNDVIRGIVHACIGNYGVKKVIGYRFGYWGLSRKGRHTSTLLSRASVHSIHRSGGTVLGTSRGPQSTEEMLETLQQDGVSILFTIGGDGTQRGAAKISQLARKQGVNLAVMGIPKTIDNDLSFSHRTFGFTTAVDQAVHAIRAGHAEASSHQYGIGIVKVMGRHSGFIAAQATISSANVNLCLVPEMPVSFEDVISLIESRFHMSHFCVICVAEGFGQDWVDASNTGTDASGNKRLIDIGHLLSSRIKGWMSKHPKYKVGTIKYIDPSYMIRACHPSASDAGFCVQLSNLAVHEAMAGVTDAIISFWYSNFIVIPIDLATSLRKVLETTGKTWRQVREVTVDPYSSAKVARALHADKIDREMKSLEDELDHLRLKRSKL